MKTKLFTLSLTAILTLSSAAGAAEIPIYTAPEGSDAMSIVVTEQLISSIWEEVQNGVGYQSAASRANTIIRKAVIAGETNGYGFGVLSAVLNNAIRHYRDMYLRPDYYVVVEEYVRSLIVDLIDAVQSGSFDYITARDTAYTRILQNVDSSYIPYEEIAVDICYQDVPSIGGTLFKLARKLLMKIE